MINQGRDFKDPLTWIKDHGDLYKDFLKIRSINDRSFFSVLRIIFSILKIIKDHCDSYKDLSPVLKIIFLPY